VHSHCLIFFYRLFTGGGPYENRTAGIPGNKHKLTPAAKAMGVYLPVSTPLATGKVLIANLIRLFQATGNVCFWPRLCEKSSIYLQIAGVRNFAAFFCVAE
jgi:hypothetical protein